MSNLFEHCRGGVSKTQSKIVKKYGYTQVPLLRIAGSSPPVARQAQADAIRAWNGGGLPTAPALSSEALRKTNSVVRPLAAIEKEGLSTPFCIGVPCTATSTPARCRRCSPSPRAGSRRARRAATRSGSRPTSG